MLFIYDAENKTFSPTEETDFRSHDILERKDIERWIADFPEVLGEELLVITTEYDKFDKTRERLDLLALDKRGNLAVIELKRDDSGKSVELQAIKYAAYCSTLTMDEAIAMRKQFTDGSRRGPTDEEIKKELLEFIENDDFEELNDRPRIMLVARDFRPEVTASVLWLRKFGIDISCIKLTPYKIGDNRVGLVSSVIIPLPEAADYTIRSERKAGIEKSPTRLEEEYVGFFQELIRALRQEISIALPEPGGRSYFSIPIGKAGIHFEWAFHGRPRSSFAVELHFEKADKDTNLRWLNEVRKHKEAIERELGESAIFQDNWGKTWARLYVEKAEGRMTDELKSWAVEKMAELYKLLQPKLDKFV